MISTYIKDNRKYYEVYVCGRYSNGRKFQKRKRLDENRQKIVSRKKAVQIEQALIFEMGLATKNDVWAFSKWHEECLRKMRLQYKVSTVENYGKTLKQWIPEEWNTKDLAEISKDEVHNLIFEILPSKGASVAMQKSTLRRLKRIFELAAEEGLISKNPARGIKLKAPAPKQLVLSQEEVNKLLLEGKTCNHAFYPLWTFALFTGMRSGEMYALRISDIDFESGIIHVNKQHTSRDGLHSTKNNKNRVVPISDSFKPFLKNLVSKGGFKEKLWQWADSSKTRKEYLVFDDLLLPRLRDWRHGEQAKPLRYFCELIGITPIKFHDLRATFITNMLSQGVAITAVMAIVGHSKMSTTDEYNRRAGLNIKGMTNSLGYKIARARDNVFQIA